MIRTENLFKSFGDNEVLKGISTSFHAGQTNLIIGRSGAGKTVLLKLLVGLFQPTSGHVFYDDIDFFSLNAKQLRAIRMEVGMLFQGNALFDSLTVEENVRFPLDMFTQMTTAEKRKRVDYCLDRVNLEGVNPRYPSEVSGGMQKRVGIARAIVLEPKYLFCDEPNSGLDPKTAIVIDELIADITKEQNITTVINTHDMNSVMEIGEKIIFLKNGYKEWEGTNKEIFKTDNEAVTNFVYSSELFKKVRQMYIEERN
ncbi:MAG: ATP-binding cassette domain-containing protein [Bacteroidota bacterium]